MLNTQIQRRAISTDSGSTIIVIIIAIVAMAGIAIGMSKMSSISVLNQLQFNQANSARGLALSGIEYAKGVAYSYSKNSKALSDVIDYLTTNPTHSLGDSIGSFTLTNITAGTDSFSLNVIGSTPSGPNQAQYKLASSVSIPYTTGEVDPDKSLYAITGAASVTLNRDNKITGSVYSKTGTTLNGDAIVDGNVISGGCVTINNGTVKGNVCTTCPWSISWSSNTKVEGNVTVFSNLTMNGGTYGGDVNVTGNLTVNGKATFGANIYAKSITFNGHQITLKGTAYSAGEINGGTYLNRVENHENPIPAACDTPTVTPKDADIGYATEELLIQDENSYTFSAANNNDPTYNSIDFTKITLNNDNKTLYFDLSQGDINILVTGDVTFNRLFTIKISPDGTTWETFDPTNITKTMKKYAKRIYLESHGTISFNGATNWVGTLYAHGFNLNKDGQILGTIYSKANLNANSGVNVTIIPSNFVDKWWTK